MGIENNISTTTTPVISPVNSRHFAISGEILQQQQVVVTSSELENQFLTLFFLALILAVISLVVAISICFIAGLELDTNVIALEWSLTSVSSFCVNETLTYKLELESEFIYKLVSQTGWTVMYCYDNAIVT